MFSFNIEKKYKNIKNNIIEQNEKNAIDWDYKTKKENGIKCKVDRENGVNVFVQSTFEFFDETDYNNALEVINNCTEDFYQNEYPIVGIESNNGGGKVI